MILKLSQLIFSGLFISLLLLSCETKEVYIDPPLTHTLKKVSEYQLEIDSITSGSFIHYQHFANDDKEYFTFLNQLDQNINFYDLKTRKLDFKVAIQAEGPNGVGNIKGFNSGYYIHSLDSIFVYHRNRGTLYLFNREASLIDSYDLVQGSKLPNAVVAPFAPMNVDNDRAQLLNIQAGMKHYKVNKSYRPHYATLLNLKTKGLRSELSYPETYTEGAWGIGLHRISWTFNKPQKKIVVSYPIDHHLYVYDYDMRFQAKYLARSPEVGSPRSISRRESKTQKGNQDHYFQQDKYGRIYFDPVRNLYIRDVLPGLSDKAVEQKENGQKPDFKRFLMLMDQNFKKLGEVEESIPGALIMFFNKEGIHKYVETMDEDILKFEVYEIEAL